MKKIIDIIHGVAIFLMFGGCLLADGLGETPGGFVILFAIIGIAGALVILGNRLEDHYEAERRRQRGGQHGEVHNTVRRQIRRRRYIPGLQPSSLFDRSDIRGIREPGKQGRDGILFPAASKLDYWGPSSSRIRKG